MNFLEIGKLIEKKGFEIIVSLSIIVFLISGGVFYFYAWKSVDYAQNSGIDGIGIKNNVLNDVLNDLNKRQTYLEELRREPISIPDIFK